MMELARKSYNAQPVLWQPVNRPNVAPLYKQKHQKRRHPPPQGATGSKKGKTQNIYPLDIGKFASLHIVGNTVKSYLQNRMYLQIAKIFSVIPPD
jgi:hypothetical protein